MTRSVTGAGSLIQEHNFEKNMTTLEAIQLIKLGILTREEVNKQFVFDDSFIKTDQEQAWDNAIDADYQEVTTKQLSE